MLVSIITCTGNRPEAFALCKKFLGSQTYTGTIEWIIVNDGVPLLSDHCEANIQAKRIKAPKQWSPDVNTHRGNMETALKHVKGDYLFILEDDDHYKPNYISTMLSVLQHVDIVGEGNAKYFNLKFPGYKEMRNLRHASLCQTAMRSSMIPYLKNAVNSGELYFDIHLWKQVQEKRIPNAILTDLNLVTGIKGMPGREGIGNNDFELYKTYIKGKQNGKKDDEEKVEKRNGL